VVKPTYRKKKVSLKCSSYGMHDAAHEFEFIQKEKKFKRERHCLVAMWASTRREGICSLLHKK